MKVKMIETGEIADVEDSWGERLLEHGKAILPEKPAKAKMTVADKVPAAETKTENAEPKADEKKAGKKR